MDVALGMCFMSNMSHIGLKGTDGFAIESFEVTRPGTMAGNVPWIKNSWQRSRIVKVPCRKVMLHSCTG